MRQKLKGQIFDSDPAFINLRGTIGAWRHVRKTLIIGCERIGIPNRFVLPHGLRIGGATDFARKGVHAYQVELWGRWRSSVWHSVYIRLAFVTLARLANISVLSIKKGITF